MIARRLVATALTIALTTSALPAVVHAEPAPAELAAARKKFDRALELEKAGDWKGALALMRDVAAVKTTAQVRFHLALCLDKLGRLVEAREEFLRSKEDADLREGETALSQKAADRIADLDTRIPKVRLKLPDDVVSAKLSIDGGAPVSLLITPTILLDPGQHQLVVTSPGSRTFTRTVIVKERDPLFTLEVDLERLMREEREEALPNEPTPTKHAAPPPRTVESKPYPWPWVFGGLGVITLGTAGVMYAMRNSTIREMDEACGPARDRCPRSIEDTESRGRTYTNVGNVFLGIGVAALTTGFVLYLAKPAAKNDVMQVRSVAVATGPSSLGITVTSSF